MSHLLSGYDSYASLFGLGAVTQWAVVDVLLVIGGQGLKVFLTETCWFRDFLAISGSCAPWVSTSSVTMEEGDFSLPSRVFSFSLNNVM
jgi:hypothetical protein